jgi:ABC-type nitrate/sulfonate/bicarbonate transport system ATPase subunit
VTAAELRKTFHALARECGSTTILITHQLEEAISVGNRAWCSASRPSGSPSIHLTRWAKSKYSLLREAIQSTLQNNRADPQLKQRGAKAMIKRRSRD